MPKAVITIDADAFCNAFMEALPTEVSNLKTKMEAAQAKGVVIGAQHFAALDALTDVKNGFCSLWPQANKQLDDIEFWINFIRPTVVAIMNAIEAAINKELYARVCPALPGVARPELHTNVSQKAR